MKVRIRWTPRPAPPQPFSESPVPAPEKAPPEPGIIEKLMIDAVGATDPGCVRSNNEDNYLVAPALGLYVVADGMGGARAGEHASKIAVDTLREVIEAAEGKVDEPALVSAFEEANRRVMGKAAEDPSMEGMGTTMVAVLEMGPDLLVASVGDSRGYLFENDALSAITEDQSWVNEVGRRLGLEEEMLKTHPMRHVLTMAIGVADQLRVHTYTLKPSIGAQILLCSDGLHGVVEESTIKDALASDESLEAKCQTLIAAARARGGPDNITAVILKTA